MRMSMRIGLTLAVLAGAVATPTAFSQLHYGGGFGPGRFARPYGPHRLYRHRSGYLYGYDRPYSYASFPYGAYGGGVYGGPVTGQDAEACHVYTDPRQDFDCRRDRLLRVATSVAVRVPGAPAGATAPADGPAYEVGWTHLVDGRPVKALGYFTAQILRAPTSGRARIGYALAAALFDDDGAAVHAMRQAIRIDPGSLRDFARDEGVDARIRELLARYTAPRDPGAVFMSAALHVLLGEREEARLVLANAAEDGDTISGSPRQASVPQFLRP